MAWLGFRSWRREGFSTRGVKDTRGASCRSKCDDHDRPQNIPDSTLAHREVTGCSQRPSPQRQWCMEVSQPFYCGTTIFITPRAQEPFTSSQRLAVYCAFKIDTSRIPRNARMARPFPISEHESASDLVQSLSEYRRMLRSLNISRISHFLRYIVDMQIRNRP